MIQQLYFPTKYHSICSLATEFFELGKYYYKLYSKDTQFIIVFAQILTLGIEIDTNKSTEPLPFKQFLKLPFNILTWLNCDQEYFSLKPFLDIKQEEQEIPLY